MEQRTISGKPLTYPVSFRLSISDYEKLHKRAVREGKTVSALVQEWVTGKLSRVKLTIESEQEDDGRWLAEAMELPGVIAYGETSGKACRNVLSLILCLEEEWLEKPVEEST